jgi:hypothetical protein
MRKADRSRPYPPEFVGLETLAYLMDCATSTIEKYVTDGILPNATNIGSLSRWHWPTVREMFRSGQIDDQEAPGIPSDNPNADRAKLYRQRLAAKNAR